MAEHCVAIEQQSCSASPRRVEATEPTLRLAVTIQKHHLPRRCSFIYNPPMQTRTRPRRFCLAAVTLVASVVWVLAPVAGRANCCCVRAAKLATPADSVPSCCHQATDRCTNPPVDAPATPHDCHCHFETCGSTPRPAVLIDLTMPLDIASFGEPFCYPISPGFTLADSDIPQTFLLRSSAVPVCVDG